MGQSNSAPFVVHFAIQVGLKLLAQKFTGSLLGTLVGGPLGFFVGLIGEHFLNFLVDKGILIVDLSLNSWKIALEEDQFKDAAKKAYDKATAKVYTEEEKDAIRQQYLKVLRDYATVGNGLRQ